MKKAVAYIAVAAIASLQISCGQGAGPKPSLATEMEKYSYMVGVRLGQMVEQNIMSIESAGVPLDTGAIKWGLEDIIKKREKLLSDSAINSIDESFQAMMKKSQNAMTPEQQRQNPDD